MELADDLCPNGTSSPGSFDVFAIELVGAMGGLLSAIVPYVKGDQLTGRYRIFLAQILLKTVAGALTAFIGILLLEGGVLAGLTVQQGSKIYAYAAFFGLAQQVVTGFVDRRAGELAKEGPQTTSEPTQESRT